MFIRFSFFYLPLFFVCLLVNKTGYANVSPYISVKQNHRLDNAINALFLAAGKTKVKSPVSVSYVKQVLATMCINKLNSSLRQHCETVNQYITRYNNNFSISDAQLSLQQSNRQNTSLANLRGVGYQDAFYAHIKASQQITSYFSYSIGAQINDDSVYFDDSYVSIGTDWMQIDIGTKPHWFSPFKNSAMTISTHAQTIPSISISNNTPLSLLDFNYEIFAGELSRSNRIRYNGEYISGKPIITGMHIDFSPFDGFTLGLNRILQSGGGDRGGNSLSDLIDAFFDPSGADNTNDDLTFDEQFGNQNASLVSQFVFPGQHPLSIYFEYAGEDTSRGVNWKLGNASLAAGIFIPRLTDNLALTVELSEWQNGWYVHSVYQDGLTNKGNIIGHWAAEQRNRDNSDSGDNIGAFNGNITLDWQFNQQHYFSISSSYTENQSYSVHPYQSSYQLAINWTNQSWHFPVTTELEFGRDVFGESFYKLSTSLSW